MIPLMKNAFFKEAETRQALADFILQNKQLSMSEQCSAFEKAFASKQGRKYAVLFNSGGSANLALLQALKNLSYVREGDKVGFSALTWSTNVMPIIETGLKPVAIDCEPSTLNVMSGNLKNSLQSEKIKILFLTNVLSFVGDIEEIRKICEQANIILIEDNCESLGTETIWGKTGNFGLASTFSFFVAHHLSTIEGGMICTDSDELAEMLKIVRANGWDRNLTGIQQAKWRNRYEINSEFEAKYSFYELGFNLRPTEITGFLGLFQLQFIDEVLEARAKIFLEIENVMRQNIDLLPLQHEHITKLPIFALPVICRTPELKKEYLARFTAGGIEVRPVIAGNIQRQVFYKKYVEDEVELPGAEFLHHNGFYCGIYPELTQEELEIIKSCLIKI
jgi:CDP-6-deoxy-D-xylo-4-hexulose-3-dehydrase